MARIILLGEAMLELARSESVGQSDLWRLGYGGDTLNTAIHLARSGHDVAYLTAIGNDPLSKGLKASWAAEGLDSALVLDHPSRATGLYAISTDAAGERSFTYWRDSSAARDIFALDAMDAAMAAAEQAELFAFSLISLADLQTYKERHSPELTGWQSLGAGVQADTAKTLPIGDKLRLD